MLKCKRGAARQNSFVNYEVRQGRFLSHCRGIKVVCNGTKKNGRQNLLCKDCGKQFQEQYRYKGCVPENKDLVLTQAKHWIGKQYTRAIEGINTFFRTERVSYI